MFIFNGKDFNHQGNLPLNAQNRGFDNVDGKVNGITRWFLSRNPWMYAIPVVTLGIALGIDFNLHHHPVLSDIRGPNLKLTGGMVTIWMFNQLSIDFQSNSRHNIKFG